MVVVSMLRFRRVGGFLGGGGGGGAFQKGFPALRGAGLFLAKLGYVGEGSWRRPVDRGGWGFGGEKVRAGGEGAACRGAALYGAATATAEERLHGTE